MGGGGPSVIPHVKSCFSDDDDEALLTCLSELFVFQVICCMMFLSRVCVCVCVCVQAAHHYGGANDTHVFLQQLQLIKRRKINVSSCSAN